jgi:hypothetical protein
MAFAKKRPAALLPADDENRETRSLQQQAVAIDPPPAGAIGIEELLGRFERLAEAQALGDLPGKGPVGVRELLERLGNLADAGYFSTTDDDEPDQK